MAKITDYSKVTSLKDTNVFLIDGPDGTKGIFAPKLAKSLIDIAPFDELEIRTSLGPYDSIVVGDYDEGPEYGSKGLLKVKGIVFNILEGDPETDNLNIKRNVWRGKNLGTKVSQSQFDAIKYGTFTDLFLGDYWVINGYTWRIVDFNYWLRTGNSGYICTTNHLVIMPDNVLKTAKINDTNTIVGGYYNSQIKKNILNINGCPEIPNAFGASHILSHAEHLTNAATNGGASGGAWVLTSMDLPNENMIYGSHMNLPVGNTSYYGYTIDTTQLAAMRLNRDLINIGVSYWLRDICNNYFLLSDANGGASQGTANTSLGVRPVFGLIG